MNDPVKTRIPDGGISHAERTRLVVKTRGLPTRSPSSVSPAGEVGTVGSPRAYAAASAALIARSGCDREAAPGAAHRKVVSKDLRMGDASHESLEDAVDGLGFVAILGRERKDREEGLELRMLKGVRLKSFCQERNNSMRRAIFL